MHVRVLLLVCMFLSCEQVTEKNSELTTLPITTAKEDYRTNPDTIPHLLKLSFDKNSFIYEDLYVRFYAGNLFSNNEKHAVTLFKVNDSVNMLRVYFYKNRGWKEVLTFKPALIWLNARIELEDMNFDAKKDLRVIRSVSNGFAMSLSHLFLYKSPVEFYYMPEADTLYNLTIGNKNKSVIISETVIDSEWGREIATHYHQWKGDKLIHYYK